MSVFLYSAAFFFITSFLYSPYEGQNCRQKLLRYVKKQGKLLETVKGRRHPG